MSYGSNIVIGVLSNAQQQVLIAQRYPWQSHPQCWEFPGGKIEPQEAPEAALKREWQEEIGISVVEVQRWMQFEYRYASKNLYFYVYWILCYQGEPQALASQQIQWIRLAELEPKWFPQANQQIIATLQQATWITSCQIPIKVID
jgi:mutator protein MutT